nr:hypothetical protein [Tanacetum cinerariifolium]
MRGEMAEVYMANLGGYLGRDGGDVVWWQRGGVGCGDDGGMMRIVVHVGDFEPESIRIGDIKLLLLAFDSQLKVFHPLKEHIMLGLPVASISIAPLSFKAPKSCISYLSFHLSDTRVMMLMEMAEVYMANLGGYLGRDGGDVVWWQRGGVGCGDDGGMMRIVVRDVGGGSDDVCGMAW